MWKETFRLQSDVQKNLRQAPLKLLENSENSDEIEQKNDFKIKEESETSKQILSIMDKIREKKRQERLKWIQQKYETNLL